jgi:uncharacterized membrane protein
MRTAIATILVIVILAALIHLAAVLSLPYLAPKNAWARVAALAEANRMVVLPPASPAHQSLPLMAPDVRYAVCRFNLENGPVRLSTQILDGLWLITFYTPGGENFYAITGRELRRNQIEIIISKANEIGVKAGASLLDEIEDLVVVDSPVKEGIAVIRAPLLGPSYEAETEAALQRGTCSRNIPGNTPRRIYLNGSGRGAS